MTRSKALSIKLIKPIGEKATVSCILNIPMWYWKWHEWKYMKWLIFWTADKEGSSTSPLQSLKVTFFRVKQCTRPDTNYPWEVNDRGANCHRKYCLMKGNPLRQSWILDYTLWIPNRPFARWHHFTTVTRILFVFLFTF